MLNTVVIVIDVISALFLIATILLHSGRGSGLSDMFGGMSTLSGGTAMERTARPSHGHLRDRVRALHLLALMEVDPVREPATGW